MYKYRCKAVADCPVADSGELTTSNSMLDEPKCKVCGGSLELADSMDGDSSKSRNGGVNRSAIVVAALVVIAVAAGGGWYAFGSAGKPKSVEQAAVAQEATNAAPPQAAPVPAAPAAVAAVPAISTQPSSGGITPSDTETSNARREADRKLSNGEFSEAEKKAARAAALEMIKTAVAKLGQGDLAGAEKELMQARERDTTEPLVYYNLAIVRLRQKQPDEALNQLEAAFMAGFSHFDAMDKDRDLDPLRGDPKFKKLVGIYRKGV
jgi:hypothetical protein